MGFDSSFTKKRWNSARDFQKFHEMKTGEKLPLKDFYKSDNAVTQELFKYEVTFELNYKGDDYEFFIPQESFTILGYGAVNNQEEIDARVKQGLADNFKGDSRNWVYNNSKVSVRGVEKVATKYRDINLNNLSNNNVYASEIPSIDVVKTNKSGGKNINKYGLNIWL